MSHLACANINPSPNALRYATTRRAALAKLARISSSCKPINTPRAPHLHFSTTPALRFFHAPTFENKTPASNRSIHSLAEPYFRPERASPLQTAAFTWPLYPILSQQCTLQKNWPACDWPRGAVAHTHPLILTVQRVICKHTHFTMSKLKFEKGGTAVMTGLPFSPCFENKRPKKTIKSQAL